VKSRQRRDNSISSFPREFLLPLLPLFSSRGKSPVRPDKTAPDGNLACCSVTRDVRDAASDVAPYRITSLAYGKYGKKARYVFEIARYPVGELIYQQARSHHPRQKDVKHLSHDQPRDSAFTAGINVAFEAARC